MVTFLCFAIMDCRPKIEDISGKTTVMLKDLSMVLECDESRVMHKVRVDVSPVST